MFQDQYIFVSVLKSCLKLNSPLKQPKLVSKTWFWPATTKFGRLVSVLIGRLQAVTIRCQYCVRKRQNENFNHAPSGDFSIICTSFWTVGYSYSSLFFILSPASVKLIFLTTPERVIMSCKHETFENATGLRLRGRCSRFLLSSDLKIEQDTIGWDSFLPPLWSDVNTPQLACFPARLHRRLNKLLCLEANEVPPEPEGRT